MTDPTPPPRTASVEAWTLAQLIGRRIWARPEDVSDGTEARWVVLLDVWMEDDTGQIAHLIDWGGQRRRATHRPMGRRHVELTAEEFRAATRRELDSGYVVYDYDPHWANSSPKPLRSYPNSTKAPKPDLVPEEDDLVDTPAGDQYTLI